MYGYNHYMWGGGWWISIILWVAIILVVIWGVRAIFMNSAKRSDQPSAMEILKRRYASGEISKDEFDRMKKDLME